MNTQEALLEARKRWGKEAAVEAAKEESSPALREAAKVEAVTLKELAVQARAKHDAVAKKYGTATAKFKASLTARIAADKAYNNKKWGSSYQRYKVGSVMNLAGFGMFSVMGEGDSWEEAFQAADKRKAEDNAKYKR